MAKSGLVQETEPQMLHQTGGFRGQATGVEPATFRSRVFSAEPQRHQDKRGLSRSYNLPVSQRFTPDRPLMPWQRSIWGKSLWHR